MGESIAETGKNSKIGRVRIECIFIGDYNMEGKRFQERFRAIAAGKAAEFDEAKMNAYKTAAEDDPFIGELLTRREALIANIKAGHTVGGEGGDANILKGIEGQIAIRFQNL